LIEVKDEEMELHPIMGDKVYPFTNWIITLYKEDGHHTILKLLYNKKHKRGHYVINNAFGILKTLSRSFFTNLN
jgi:hypothetical protein